MSKYPYTDWTEERNKIIRQVIDDIGEDNLPAKKETAEVSSITRDEMDLYLGNSAEELLRKLSDSKAEIDHLITTITNLETALDGMEEPEIIDDLASYNQKRREIEALRTLHGETLDSSSSVLQATRRKCDVLINIMREHEDIPKDKWIRCGTHGINLAGSGYIMRPWSEIEIMKNPYALGTVSPSDYVIGGTSLLSIAGLLGASLVFSWAFLILIIPVVLVIFAVGASYQRSKAEEYERVINKRGVFHSYV